MGTTSLVSLRARSQGAAWRRHRLALRHPLRAFAVALCVMAVWCCSAQAATAPTVTGISPNAGPTAGGTIVTITGTGFVTAATTVDFGLLAATVTVTSSTSLKATAPAGTGTVDVVVVTAGGTSTTSSADQYTYDSVSTVTGVSPAAGPVAGGTVVSITGSGFVAGSTVAFGSGHAATSVTVTSPTSLTATAPAVTAGAVDIRVTTPGGTSATSSADQFSFDPVPAVTSVSPNVGSAIGGTAVTITGTGFIAGASAVAFGPGQPATNITVNSATSITATAPAESAGTVDITVATPGGSSLTGAADRFTFDPVPTVAGVSPIAGPLAGGTRVTISGTGFVAGATVAFGAGHAGTSVTVNSPTSITATAPAESAGAVDVTITTPGGTTAIATADQYTYDPLPTVTGVGPNVGPVTGGTSVTITGTGFIAGATTVSFGTGNAAASVTVNSSTSITATSPTGAASSVDVIVTTPGGTSATGTADKFTFDPVPAVTDAGPIAGPLNGGTSVTITGTGFIAGATSVTFGATDADAVTVNSPTSVTAAAPAESAGTVDITVTTPGGTSATGPADQFTYEAVPTVTAIAPSAGPIAGGTQVTITGTDFVAGGTSVSFGTGHAATNVTVTSPTTITASPPAESAGTVDVRVTTAGGTSYTSAADQFTFDAAPTVTAVAASAGPTSGGTTITITGTNFVAGASTVAFGTQTVPSVTVSSTTMTATSPAGTAGAVDVTVTTPGGTSATTTADKFTYDPPPAVTAINPTGGPLGGGTSVTISGSNFIAGATTVAFGGGHPGTSVVINSPTSITAMAPAGTAGTVDVTVTTPGGTSATSGADQFTYDPVPSVWAVAPGAGPTGGGSVVVVSGTGFVAGVTAVAFGSGHAASSVTVTSSTSLTATAPAGTLATVDVTVTTPGGTSPTGAGDKFTYDPLPTVSGVSPGVGPTAGGSTLTITGANFIAGATTVAFGTAAASNVTVNSATSITATSPAGSAGTADVTVTTPGGTSATSSADRFIYDPPPAVTAVSPAGGPLGGATIVTITGTGFIAGASTVAFGSGHAGTSVVINSPTSITATAPAGSAGTVDVTVTTPGGTSASSGADQFSYDPVPTVTGVAPGAGPTGGGTVVAVSGTGFVAGSTSVAFGAGHAATNITVTSATSLTATAPAGAAATDDIVVTTPGGSSATGAADKFTYDPVPTVTAVSPGVGSAAGGTSVTITGTSFIAGATTVAFGTVAATSVTVKSATSITATAPPDAAGTIDVTVATPGGPSPTSSADRFTYDPVPTVVAANPSAGPLAGATIVTITGTGFISGATAVAFGAGHAAASVTVTSPTSLTATAPAALAGTVDIAVTTPGGTSAPGAADQFSYDPVPTVSAVSPAAGPNAGGATVTITGTGFVAGLTSVAFGAGHAATNVTVTSPTTLTATSPAEPAGTVDITVSTPGGTSATGPADRYAADPLPTVTAVSPSGGPVSGGTNVTITGTNFIAGATSVAFGTIPAATITIKSPTSITATTPAGTPATVDITVTTPGGTSATGPADAFGYDPVPTVTAVAPSGGPIAGGTTVTVTGTGFVAGATTVAVGTGRAAASVTVTSSTSLTATTPAETAATVDLIVTTPGGTSATGAGDRFSFDPIPTITSIGTTNGPAFGGTTVTITGTGFVPGATTVAFGNGHAAATTAVNSATSITVTSPVELPGGVDITVTTPGGTSTTSSTDRFTFNPPPSVTAVSPGAGPLAGATTVTVTGTGFISGATSVAFGAHDATKVTVSSATSLTAVAPAEPAGTVDITVTTGNGTSSQDPSDVFTYAPVPSVSAVSPSAAPITGGTRVTITGSGFIAGATTVNFGAGHPATSVTVNSSTSITASAPAGSAATIDITVSTPGGASYTGSADKFTYAAAPTVTEVSPADGPASGGTAVTITGTDFIAGATTVQFGTRRASGVSVSATSITATAPTETAGTVDITVATPGGTSATSTADKFNYHPVPTITSLSPDAGPVSGATKVTIKGSDLAGATAVAFGGKPATSFKVASDTEITVIAPPRSAGAVHVTVTSPAGSSGASHTSRFTYAIAPAATSRPAGALTATTAALRGTARPNGLAVTTCLFEYGRSARYGHVIACAGAANVTGAAAAVSATLAHLAPGSTYHFRLRIRTQAGTGVSPDQQFTTPGPPAAGGTSSHLAPLVQSVTNRHGIIGRLTGITGVAGASGETVTIACRRGCTSRAVRRIVVGRRPPAGGRLTLRPPILLSPSTQIQVRVTAAGRPSRSVRYAFSLVGSKLTVRRL